MFAAIKRIGLGLVLIALASSVLLYSDLASRRQAMQPSTQVQRRVALVEPASQTILKEGVDGILAALVARGYRDGEQITIKRYNAEGDLPVANAIAREVTSGGFDLIITVSTVTLQTVANANRHSRQTPHVFGLVTDPYGAGVGINRTNTLDHPPHMTGYGTMQPVASAFQIARQMRPQLKRVGLVWNPTESNSEAQTRLAREVCRDLGIELIEANAENSTAVAEAASSLVSKGVEAIWVSGDVTVLVAVDAVTGAARRGKIPCFTSIPPTIKKGALFDLGANYTEVGRSVGELAADVLDGKAPAEIPVENLVPEIFALNETVIAGLKDVWSVPDSLRQRAALILDKQGFRRIGEDPIPRPLAGKEYRMGLAFFAPESGAENCMKGIFDGLRELGFEEGKNLAVRRVHAQAEIANIPAMLQTLDSTDVDVIVAMSTPVIGGAAGLVRRKPVVLTYCSDPIAAGAGKSFEDHLPHMTGIGSFPPVQDMVDLIRGTVPGVRTVGTIYNASEANSRKVVEVARGLFQKAGIELQEATVAGTSEVLQAAQALASRRVDAFYIQGDNTVAQAFEVVVKTADTARIPLFCDDPDLATRGALACVGLGYYASGYEAAKPIARVLTGTKPAAIPIRNVSQRAVVLYEERAANLGLKFPAKFAEEAARAKQQKAAPAAKTVLAPLGRKARLALLEYTETPNVELARNGLFDGLKLAGLQPGRDYELKVHNAHGDMATLSTIADSIVTDRADLVFASTTPALQAALRRIRGIPIVFVLVANPVIAGAGKNDHDHLPNVTGAYAPAPHAEGLSILKRLFPSARRLGTLYVPAEVNSVFYFEDLVAAAKTMDFQVEAVGVSASGEIPDAAMALCGRRIDIFTQISDNLTGASFSSITQVAKRARVPLIGFASGQGPFGTIMTISRDFYDNGVESAAIGARILRGEKPAAIPFQMVKKIRLTFNPAAAAAHGVKIPDDLLARATEVFSATGH